MARGKQQKSNKSVTLPAVPGFTKTRAETTRAIVQNPETGGYQFVNRSATNAPLEAMHDRGHINLEQLQAGQRYRRLWDAANIGRNIGIDTTREAVDTSPTEFSHHPETIDAIREIGRAQRRLGMITSLLVEQVCVAGFNLKQVTDHIHNNKPPSGMLKQYRIVFRTGLTDLAYHWHIMEDPIRRRATHAFRSDMSDQDLASIPEQPPSAVYHAAPPKQKNTKKS